MVTLKSNHFMNTTFIGFTHNSVDLAACGLAFVTMNIISVSMADGISDGMDVLVSKAFGRDDIESCEIYLNLCRYTILLLAIPQAIITIFLNHILILFGQNEEVAYRAWTMCLFTFPGVVMMNLFECDRRYLACCELVNPGMYISIGCILHSASWHNVIFICDTLWIWSHRSWSFNIDFIPCTFWWLRTIICISKA